MKISAIIPAFNAQKTIARALQSVLSQTRPADEVIVVDDGSTDNTADVIRSFGDAVRLIGQNNAGVSAARNAGIRAASGDWIAFLDADDEWLPEKVNLQIEHLQRHPELVWTFSNMLWDCGEPGKFVSSHPTKKTDLCEKIFDDYFQAYIEDLFVSTITVMLKKSVFDTVGYFEPGMKRAQDNDLWYRVAYQFPRIGYLSRPLSVYHLDTPASSTKVNDSVDFMIELVTRHERLSKQHGRYEAFLPCIIRMLGTWTRQMVKQKRYTDVRRLLKHFPQYVSGRFQREMRFRLLCPPLTGRLADGILYMKNSCCGIRS